MDEREFEVVIWGATGFTGRLVAEHLLRRFGVGRSLRWALAGRDLEKLEDVRAGLGEEAADLPLLLADADDQSRLDAMAARTRVVCTTVGPYSLHGSKLVAACVHHGTHSCDLAGEVQWMRKMIDVHHNRARETGARIVHACGFDSIPSDLGVLLLQRAMRRQHAVPCREIKLGVREFRGAFSGGTVASMLNMLDEAERDPVIRSILEDPYALNPEGERHGPDGPDRTVPVYDRDFEAWSAPFVMALINTRVVRRSNALLDFAYGRDFRYEEGMLMPFGVLGFPLAASVSAGSAAFTAVAGLGAIRQGLSRLLAQPGEGPSRRIRESGRYVIELLGRHPKEPSRSLKLTIRGDQDPGYGSTSKMLGEAAVCLAQDPLDSPGGVSTPAASMGKVLIDRLERHAGLSFEVTDSDETN